MNALKGGTETVGDLVYSIPVVGSFEGGYALGSRTRWGVRQPYVRNVLLAQISLNFRILFSTKWGKNCCTWRSCTKVITTALLCLKKNILGKFKISLDLTSKYGLFPKWLVTEVRMRSRKHRSFLYGHARRHTHVSITQYFSTMPRYKYQNGNSTFKISVIGLINKVANIIFPKQI